MFKLSASSFPVPSVSWSYQHQVCLYGVIKFFHSPQKTEVVIILEVIYKIVWFTRCFHIYKIFSVILKQLRYKDNKPFSENCPLTRNVGLSLDQSYRDEAFTCQTHAA